MAATATAIFGAAGLAVDLGRMFIAKNETQAFCDAAALAAGLKLNGASTGITNARNAVGSTANGWNLGTANVTSYTVEFATTADGPWVASPSPATGYTYARVSATVPVQLYFLPVLVRQFTSNVQSMAVAAQIPGTSYTRGLVPYTAVGANNGSPTFGFNVGEQYSIQWPQYNGSRAGCNASHPDRCFNSSPCDGDPNSSLVSVSQYWGASVNGYWGSNSNNVIRQEVLDVIQTQPVVLGQQMTMSTGNKNAEAMALDDRVNQDMDVLDNNVSAYLANPNHNGRRFIAVPIVQPAADGTWVIGFGAFLLLSNGSPSTFYQSGTGNDPFCAVYAGSYVQGSSDPGGSTSTGSFKVMLVL